MPRRHDALPEAPSPLCRRCSPKRDREDSGEAARPELRLSSPPQQERERPEEVGKEEEESGPIKMEASSYPCKPSYPLPPHTEAQPQPEAVRAPEGYPPRTAAEPQSQGAALTSPEHTSTSARADKQPDHAVDLLAPRQGEIGRDSPPTSPPIAKPTLPVPEDPMAGMLALLAASEMAPAHPCSPAPTPTVSGALEMVALEGMALLSQVVQQDVEPLSPDRGELVVVVVMMKLFLICRIVISVLVFLFKMNKPAKVSVVCLFPGPQMAP